MKRCPKCAATFTDAEIVFCEVDGGRLTDDAAATPSVQRIARAPTLVATCPACGQECPDEGDGYCNACGHRLDDARPTPPLVPLGAIIGGGEVVAARAPDELVVKMADGAELTVCVGAAKDLEHERAALVALGGEPPFPGAVGHGGDPRHGSFLTLATSLRDAKKLAEAQAGSPLAGTLATLRALLDAAARVEAIGFDWTPAEDDLYVAASGALALSRLRGARPLPKEERIDAKRVLEASRPAFVPSPAVLGPPALLHLLVPGRRAAASPRLTIDAARAALDAVEESLPTPPDLAPRAGAVCDPGLRRDHNEDAVAVAAGETKGERWTVLVVCDGVSSSTHAEQASQLASKTACDALAHFARSGDIAFEAATGAMAAAIRAAHLSVCAQGIEHANDEPPGTTLVAALVYRRRLTVGWVGDSRAYWVSPKGGSELLTRDHSWANEAVARGEMSEEEAMRAPLAHALTKCLGPLEVNDVIAEIDPDVRARDLPGPGHVVLCTDGLWNYFPNAADVAKLIATAPSGATATALARLLVNHALSLGGQDNVTVAVLEHG